MAEYAEMVEKVIAEMGETTAGTAFGEPKQVGERMVIPVGKEASYRPIVDFSTVAGVGAFLLGLAAIRLIRRH